MIVPKEKVLYDAVYVLNKQEQPWVVTVEGDAIVARWKWMDATFFAPHEINDETRNYSFTCRLDNKNKWRELDTKESKSKNVKLSGNTIGFGTSKSTFKGKTSQKSFEFGIGKNNQTGDIGFIGFKFDTNIVKKSVRDYLAYCGWKKAGGFG